MTEEKKISEYLLLGETEMEKAVKEAGELLNKVNAVDFIQTDNECEAVNGWAAEAGRRWNFFEEERKKIKSPMLEAIKRLDSFFNIPLEKFKKIKAIGKQKMAVYLTEKKRKADEEQARIMAAAKKKEDDDRAKLKAEADALAEQGDIAAAEEKLVEAAQVEEQVPVIIESKPEIGGSFLREELDGYDIVNEDLVPDEYWILDDKAIRAVGRKEMKSANIPGIKFKFRADMTIKTKEVI